MNEIMNTLFPCKKSNVSIEYLLDFPLIWNSQGGVVHEASITRYDVFGNFSAGVVNQLEQFTQTSVLRSVSPLFSH